MTTLRPRAGWNSEMSQAFLRTAEQARLLPDSSRQAVEQILADVQTLADNRPELFSWTRFVEWWTGSRIELSWSLLHEAQFRIIYDAPPELLEEVLEIVVEHAETLPADDPARARLVAMIKEQPEPLSVLPTEG